MSTANMGLVLLAANEGYLADVEVNKIKSFEAALLSFANSEYAALMAKINEKGDYNGEIEASLKECIREVQEHSGLVSPVPRRNRRGGILI